MKPDTIIFPKLDRHISLMNRPDYLSPHSLREDKIDAY